MCLTSSATVFVAVVSSDKQEQEQLMVCRDHVVFSRHMEGLHDIVVQSENVFGDERKQFSLSAVDRLRNSGTLVIRSCFASLCGYFMSLN